MNRKHYFLILLFMFVTGVMYSPAAIVADARQTVSREAITPHNATIEITYEGTWSAAAQTALEHAAAIWEPLLQSVPPIQLTVAWDVPTDGIAFTSMPHSAQSGNYPITYAWYPSALANALRGHDICNNCQEMVITFSNNVTNWYFGTDGNPPGNQYDFVTVALRQIGIGLGLKHSFRYYPVNSTGRWGDDTYGYPNIYDLFIYNGSNQQLIDTAVFPNPSNALYVQMISNNIFFNGPYAVAANGGQPPKLYAPATWWHPSFMFLDETAFPTGTANALMTPIIQPGEVIHEPGPVLLGILHDMGWPAPNQTPSFAPLPNQLLQINTIRDNAIDLWAYVSDDQPDNQLTFVISNSPDPDAGVSLDSNRYIDINPTPNWTGETSVEITVADPAQASSTGSFVVLVADLSITQYLPVVLQP